MLHKMFENLDFNTNIIYNNRTYNHRGTSMSIIYEPSGMAKEYSPYACNLYIGCSHRCKYCYAPHTL